ncbi:MAG: beta-galactosidase [Solirubrobacteraceae bacterium]
MTKRFSKSMLVALALGCALPTLAPSMAQSVVRTPTGPPLAGVNAPGFSFGASPASINQEISWAKEVGAHVIRVEFPWSVLEPQEGHPAAHALAFTDRFVNGASAAGIKVVALATRTPCWASSAPASVLSKCQANRNTRANAWPPTNPSDYGSFVAFLAARYGSKLAAIEVWNEPDQANEDYLAGPNKAQRYAEILKAAYPAIKQVAPTMTVLGGSLVGSNGAFLRALYAAGIKGYYDGLSVHFYNLVLASLRYLHEVQLANGDTTPLWLNEFGWSSCWPGRRVQQEQACVTDQVQATNLKNVFRSLARTPWVAADIMYELQGSRREDFGVFTETGAHKPSFGALRGVFRSPFGRPSSVTVHLGRRGGRVLVSGSAPVGDYLQMEAFKAGRAVYRAQFTLDRFNHYAIALPGVLGTRGLRVSVFQYWAGSARTASASI